MLESIMADVPPTLKAELAAAVGEAVASLSDAVAELPEPVTGTPDGTAAEELVVVALPLSTEPRDIALAWNAWNVLSAVGFTAKTIPCWQ